MSDTGKQRPDTSATGTRPGGAEVAPAHELPVDPDFPSDDNAPADERVDVVKRPEELPESSPGS